MAVLAPFGFKETTSDDWVNGAVWRFHIFSLPLYHRIYYGPCILNGILSISSQLLYQATGRYTTTALHSQTTREYQALKFHSGNITSV